MSRICGLALFPNGSVAVGGDDGSIQVWNPDTGGQRRLNDAGDDQVHALAVTPDGELLLAAMEPRGVLIWKLGSDTAAEILADSPPRSLALTPDGKCVIAGGRDGTITAWSLDTRSQLWRVNGHGGAVRSVTVSPDGHRIATSGIDGFALWDRNTGMLESWHNRPTAVHAITVAPGGRLITSEADGSIRLWDEHGAERLIRGPQLQAGAVRSMAVTPDGKRLVTSGEYDGSVRVWNPHSPL